MTHKNRFLAAVLFTVGCLQSVAQINYPTTATGKQVDTYHGRQVPDPYRWLEDENSADTRSWIKAQNATTDAYLEKIPYRNKVKERLTALWNYNKMTAPFRKGNYYFSQRNDGLQNQSVLYKQKALLDKPELLLDPNLLSKDGTVSLGSYAISKDGKYLAYGISSAGSDWVEIRVKEIESGKELSDVVKWVKFSGIAWKGNGFYYSRYDEPKDNKAYTQKNEFHKLYFHTVGTPQSQDQLVFEDKAHGDRSFSAEVTHDEHYLLLYASETTSGQSLKVKDLTNLKSGWITLVDNFEDEYSLVDNIGNQLYVLTNYKAPRYRLVKINLNNPDVADWEDVLPEKDDLLQYVTFSGDKLVSCYLHNVSSKMSVHSVSGKVEKEIALPGICTVNGLNGDREHQELIYSVVSFTAPTEVYFTDLKGGQPKRIFKPNIDFKSQDYVTKQVFYTSKDGTKIPMFITHKKDLVPDGTTPCFLYGYGGFNISITPEFRIDRAVFLEAGGIYCVANMRGGGEFGESWHAAGTKCKKQNVFDDFIAAADYLVDNKYTSHDKLAIHGRSNGGLLIGAVMTERPDLAKVAIPTVGVLDMLRFHLFTIGRAWTVDFGSSENKDEFDCLIKYSPLHNARPAAYPATLVMTGDHDDRVVPAHSFKFISAIQKNNTGKNPTLIRIDTNAGHGSGKPTAKQIDEFSDMWSFVFFNLGMNY